MLVPMYSALSFESPTVYYLSTFSRKMAEEKDNKYYWPNDNATQNISREIATLLYRLGTLGALGVNRIISAIFMSWRFLGHSRFFDDFWDSIHSISSKAHRSIWLGVSNF